MIITASLLNLGGPDLIIILGIVYPLFEPTRIGNLARGMRGKIHASPEDSELSKFNGREFSASFCLAFLLLAAAALINSRFQGCHNARCFLLSESDSGGINHPTDL